MGISEISQIRLIIEVIFNAASLRSINTTGHPAGFHRWSKPGAKHVSQDQQHGVAVFARPSSKTNVLLRWNPDMKIDTADTNGRS